MKKNFILCLMLCILGSVFTRAQNTNGPASTTTARFLGKTKALRDYPVLESKKVGIDELTIVNNKYGGSFDNLIEGFSDPKETLQSEMGSYRTPSNIGVNFQGISITQSKFFPPDPTGAVGPNHYVHAVNSAISIFSKTGDLLLGPVALGTFLDNPSNEGDPIVLYDQLADRWLVSEFGPERDSLLIGISETGDPTGAFNVYEILEGRFEDYPHYSIWPDGYYLTTNGEVFGGGFNPREVFVLERDVMLEGGESPQVVGLNLTGQFANPITIFSPGSANLLGTDLPLDSPGLFIYLQDDSWDSSIDTDKLLIWEAIVDWDDISNSTISANPQEIPVGAFDSVFAPFGTGEIEQPGTSQKLSSQAGIISYQANYRVFENHNSWLITFNVDVDGNDTSGIRWIELRNTSNNQDWALYQEGTYAPDDGNSRFMSSSSIDRLGNIGLAFNIGGPTKPIGINYTGRFNNDPLGQMTVAETVIFDGEGVQLFTNRFGDYSHMTLDPDDLTFWHTSQYFGLDNEWITRISSFQLSGGFANDLGVTTIVNPNNGILTATETVDVVILNHGTEAQANFPITLSVDGVVVATEMFTGSIPAGETASYTFMQTVDLSVENQTYLLEARTQLDSDEFLDNDLTTKEVVHLPANDLGVTEITSPTSGMLDMEEVIISITNFGGNTQSGFDVQYIVDGGTPVVETFTGSIEAEETTSYTFTAQADLSQSGPHIIVSKTNLEGDQETTNDELSLSVLNICTPMATEGCSQDGIKQFVLNTINADDGGDGCNSEPEGSPTGYSNRTDLFTTLSNVAGQNEYVLQAQHNQITAVGVEALSVWIDFNDDGVFDATEQLIAGEFFQAFATLENFNLTIPVGAALGSHIMRVKAINTSASGNINEACSDFAFGEVQDYTVIIDGTLGVDDMAFVNAIFNVLTSDNKNFDVVLTSPTEGNVFIGVYNLMGQQLKYKQVNRNGNTFSVALDMTNVSSGIYFVKMMTTESSRIFTRKIIVD